MSINDLIPWGRSNNQTPSVFRDGDRDPFLSLHREVNRLFDDVRRSFDSRFAALDSMPSLRAWPNVEISETDKEIKVTAEIPGLEEKDIDVLLNEGVLTLKGEKRSETEDKEKQFSERFYGRFERRIPLNGVLRFDFDGRRGLQIQNTRHHRNYRPKSGLSIEATGSPKVLQISLQIATNMESIQELEGRFSQGVMAARQHHRFVVHLQLSRLGNHLLGKSQGKSRIVASVNK